MKMDSFFMYRGLMNVPEPRFLKIMPSCSIFVSARFTELRLTWYVSLRLRSSGNLIFANCPEKIFSFRSSMICL
ncbi:hypothetical protein D3C74_268940 [compost metagenome]